MPFGLDLKSLVLGALFVAFVLPWLKALLQSRSSGNSKAA